MRRLYNSSMVLKEPLSLEEFEVLHKKSEQKVWDTFNEKTKELKEEQLYEIFQSQLANNVKKLRDIFFKKNIESVRLLLEDIVVQGNIKFQEPLKPVYSQLPLDDEELNSNISSTFDKAMKEFKQKTSKFQNMKIYKEAEESLRSKIKYQISKVESHNIEQFKILSTTALNRAKKIVQNEANDFYFSWNFRNFVFSVCERELGGSIKSKKTMYQVISHFYQEDLRSERSHVESWTRGIGVAGLGFLGVIMFVIWNQLAKDRQNSKKNR